MDNETILAELETKKLELATSLPRLSPAKSASQFLTLPIQHPALRSEEEIERERLDKERERLFAASGAPRRHHVRPNAVSPPAWGNALESVGKMNRGFTVALIGPRGTGKTQMAVNLIRATCNSLLTAHYAKAVEVFIRIKGAYNAKAAETEKEAIAAFCKPSLLVLDEMSERGESQWEERMLRHIIDVRYDDQKDTVLIGNFTPAEFAQSIGDSVASRIQETGGLIECNWKSFRSK